MDCEYTDSYVSEAGQENPDTKKYVFSVKVRDAHVVGLINSSMGQTSVH